MKFRSLPIRQTTATILFAAVLVVPPILSGGRDAFSGVFVAVVLFGALFLALRFSREGLRWPKPNPFIPLALYVLAGAVSLTITVSRYDSIVGIISWMTLVLVGLAGYLIVPTKELLRKAGILFLALGSVLSVVGVVFFLLSEQYSYVRLVSTFYYHNGFAGFLLLLLPLAVTWFMTAQKMRWRILSGVCAWLMLTAIVLTHSRASWVAGGIVLLTMLWMLRKRLSRRSFAALGILVVVIAGSAWGLQVIKQHQASQIGDTTSVRQESAEANATTARIEYFKDAFGLAFESPILGKGLNTYAGAVKAVQGDVRFYSADPHNIVATTAAETGVIGVILLVWAITAVYRSIQRFTKRTNSVLAIGLSLGLLAQLLHLGFDADWWYPANSILFFGMTGMLLRVAVTTEDSDASSRSRSFGWVIPIATLFSFLILGASLVRYTSDDMVQEAQLDASVGWNTWAEEHASMAHVVDPISPSAFYTHGRLLSVYTEDASLIDQARDLAEQAVTWSSTYDAAYDLSAEIAERQGDTEAAKAYLRKAIAVNKYGVPQYYTELTGLLLKESAYDDVIALLEPVLPAFSPEVFTSPLAWTTDKVVTKQNIADLHVSLALAYRETGRTDDARQSANDALALIPDHASALDLLSSLP